MANEKFICLGCPSKSCDHHKAHELICSVCEQRIEPTREYRHADGYDWRFSMEKGCNGKAVPKVTQEAPEPTGEDRATPWVHVPHLPGYEWRLNSNGYRETRPLELKAPDVIKVDLPPLTPNAECDAADGYFEDALEQREEQLKAEIAAKNRALRQEELMGDVLTRIGEYVGFPAKSEMWDGERLFLHIVGFAEELRERAEKAEKERDQLRRDLDAAKELLKEYMEDHECPNGPDDTQCQSTIKARNLLK